MIGTGGAAGPAPSKSRQIPVPGTDAAAAAVEATTPMRIATPVGYSSRAAAPGVAGGARASA